MSLVLWNEEKIGEEDVKGREERLVARIMEFLSSCALQI